MKRAAPRRSPPSFKIGSMMSDVELLRPYFKGDSWSRWRAVLRAAFAEPLSADDLALFRDVAGGREPQQQRVSELIAIAGRGAGKDSIASLIVTTIAVNFDPKGKLRPGERATVLAIAVDREQAALVYRYIKGHFESVPALTAMVASYERGGIILKNHVEIVIATNSYRAVRGRSLLACIFDEVAFWRDEESAIPDVEVFAAVQPGLARVPGSMLVMISTAYKRAGLLYQRYQNYFGKENDDTLVVLGTTLQFNPLADAARIAKQIEDDPQVGNAEYNAVWRDDLAGFLTRDLLEAAVDRGVTVRPPVEGVRYFAFVDSSGGRGDSFTLGIAHQHKEAVVLDVAFERPSPFNPAAVVEEVAATLKSYRCRYVTGDFYSAGWIVGAFAKTDIQYRKSNRDRSKIYLDVLPLFTSGRARLLDNSRMISQFAGLERRAYPTGRDVVDHRRDTHDDVCNAALLAR